MYVSVAELNLHIAQDKLRSVPPQNAAVAGYSETGEAVETTMTLKTVDYTQLYDIDRLSQEMNRFYGGQEETELDDAA